MQTSRSASSRTIFATLTAVTLMASVLCSIPAASASPKDSEDNTVFIKPDPSPADVDDAYSKMLDLVGYEALVNNEDLMLFGTWIEELSGIFESGYYDAEVNINTRTMTLLWHGSSPLQKIIADEAEKRKITLQITSVPYTRAGVRKAMAALMDTDIDTPQGKWRISGISGPDLDKPYLTVPGFFATDTTRRMTANQQHLLQKAVSSIVLQATADDLSVVVEDGSPDVPFTRSNDASPFWAGGMIRGADNSGCTSGFAVVYQGTSHTTTARHCASTPYRAWDAPANSYGLTYSTSASGQARILTGLGGANMFEGAWNNASSLNKKVIGALKVKKGELVCSSGANSGVHCNLLVENLTDTFDDGINAQTTIRVKQQVGGQIAGARGDSGGPIFSVKPGDTSKVYAVGMLQGAPTATLINSCGSLRISAQCSMTIQLTSIEAILKPLSGAILLV
ncbi:MAG: S1 family peptidase [Propionibacteriaceae bacterium]|nr:S1 family peptidase [Propionibacteriaceae bacterium]